MWSYLEQSSGGSTDPFLWSHLNHLHFDGEQDLFLVTDRNFDRVFAIRRSTGDTEWVLGGDGGDSVFMESWSSIPTARSLS